MKNKNRLIAIAIIFAVTAIGISNLLPSYSATLKANWGISLPWKARLTEIYEQDSGGSFHGAECAITCSPTNTKTSLI